MTSMLRKAVLVGALMSAWASAHATLTIISGTRAGDAANMGQPPSGAAKTAHDAFVNSQFVNVTGTESFTGSTAGTPPFAASGVGATIGCAYPPVAPFFPGGPACDIASSAIEGRFDTTSGAGKYLTSVVLDPVFDGSTVGPIVLTFTDPLGVSAFGFYGTDIGDFGGDFTVILTDLNGVETSQTLVDSGAPDGSLLFWGFYDSAKSYKSVTFVNSLASDGFGIDDLIVGAFDPGIVDPPGVPEPMSGLLALAALVAAGSARRLRR